MGWLNEDSGRWGIGGGTAAAKMPAIGQFRSEMLNIANLIDSINATRPCARCDGLKGKLLPECNCQEVIKREVRVKLSPKISM